MTTTTDRNTTMAGTIQAAPRETCRWGVTDTEAGATVTAITAAGYQIAPRYERTLAVCDNCGLGYPPSQMVRGLCVGCAEEQMTAMERACERMAGERDESAETLADILSEPGWRCHQDGDLCVKDVLNVDGDAGLANRAGGWGMVDHRRIGRHIHSPSRRSELDQQHDWAAQSGHSARGAVMKKQYVYLATNGYMYEWRAYAVFTTRAAAKRYVEMFALARSVERWELDPLPDDPDVMAWMCRFDDEGRTMQCEAGGMAHTDIGQIDGWKWANRGVTVYAKDEEEAYATALALIEAKDGPHEAWGEPQWGRSDDE